MVLNYSYKGKEYFIESVGEMKNPCTREWESCVIYIQYETGLRFVREAKEFYKLFKKVKNEFE